MALPIERMARLGALAAGLALAFAPAAATVPAPAPAAQESAVGETAAAPRPDVGTSPRPAIWLLADEDTRIFLFGTIHILPPGLVWRSAALDRAVAEADELVLEVAEDPASEDAATLAPLLTMGKSVPLLSRVSPERRKPLREIIMALGLPVETFDSMQTWAAAMSITVAAMAQAYAGQGAEPEPLTGVEDALRGDFLAAGRPIFGVETSEQQLGFLSGLPPRVQREMLEAMVDAYLQGDADMAEPSESGWLGGDVERIAEEMAAMPPELYDVLLTRRNRAWTEWLIARLERPGTVLFAVGAGHLAGPESVQAMLETRGSRVTRLD